MTNELYEKHCWALVDLDAMQSNLALIQKTVGAPVCCVVKADAYGHGAAVAGPWLEENGAAAFAVSCLAEARHLRRHGISKPILILGYTDPLQVDQLAFNCITQTVYSEEYAKALSAAAQNAGSVVPTNGTVCMGVILSQVGVGAVCLGRSGQGKGCKAYRNAAKHQRYGQQYRNHFFHKIYLPILFLHFKIK